MAPAIFEGPRGPYDDGPGPPLPRQTGDGDAGEQTEMGEQREGREGRKRRKVVRWRAGRRRGRDQSVPRGKQ